jgi:hypothetical protein
VLLLMFSASACQGAPTAAPVSPPAPTTAPATERPPAVEATVDFEGDLEDFDPANFDDPTNINNRWFPLQPGRQLVTEGFTEESGLTFPHRIIFTVTDLTKEINGVKTVVAWVEDYSDNELVEAELAFYAQDNDGNVWFLGEYPEVYEDGKMVEAPAWIAGFKGARAGIVMKAGPVAGAPSYSQGWGPAVDWTDRAQVVEMGLEICVPVDCYEDVLKTEEFSRSEPEAFQVKYYAPGVGNVKVGWRGADATKEELELVELNDLDAEELAEVRALALELEKHAYEISKEVYDQTPPAEHNPPQANLPVGSLDEVILYATDLPESALFEMDFYDDPASPGGKMIGLLNTGDELDPPPESDPHVTFTIQVQSGVPYRCWIHMKVGEPFGVSQANVIYAQFTNAVDQAGNEIFNVGTSSYLTAEGPTQLGWAWVECDRADSEAEPLVYFRESGEVTVRLQAGMEGVGFDQFVLSPDRFLDRSPAEPIVEK